MFFVYEEGKVCRMNCTMCVYALSLSLSAVAVGGSDDCVQLLQCRKQQCGQTAHTPNQQQQSILKYGENQPLEYTGCLYLTLPPCLSISPVRGKQFSHTHTLRGKVKVQRSDLSSFFPPQVTTRSLQRPSSSAQAAAARPGSWSLWAGTDKCSSGPT